jgi:hypothetical protein
VGSKTNRRSFEFYESKFKFTSVDLVIIEMKIKFTTADLALMGRKSNQPRTIQFS